MGFFLKLSNIKFLQFSGANWHDIPHSHEDVYQISIPMSGKLIANLNNHEYILKNGESIIANPLSIHGHQFSKETSSMFIIGLNKAQFNEWIRDNYGTCDEVELNEQQIIIPNELRRNLKQWVNNLLLEQRTNLLESEVEQNAFHYFSNILKGSHNSTVNRLVSADIYLNHVLEYIHSHYNENIRIETLAELAHQSKFHFIRSFKKQISYTPYQYVLSLRIEQGKEMLRNSNKTITEISYELGFSSPSQFHRNFVIWVGCTPKQFRD
ncbi:MULTISPECIES: AraC family transcriptional regulator [Bacillus]|nr:MULTISPECIES: AraC family transcriptional regulator [Bacillus]